MTQEEYYVGWEPPQRQIVLRAEALKKKLNEWDPRQRRRAIYANALKGYQP